MNNKYNNFIFNHHLFLNSGKISDKAKYNKAQDIIEIIINLFHTKKSVNGKRISAHSIHHKAAKIT